MTTRDDLLTALIHAGPAFYGNDAPEIADEWEGEFGSDYRTAITWIEAGFWDPTAAAELMYSGMRPRDELRYQPGREKDHGFGIDPIYSFCNGDCSLADLRWN